MKKAFFLSVLFLAGAVSAAESANIIGYMPVSSTSARTLVAVPWCEFTTGSDAAICISNLVETSNLTPGTSAENADTLTALNSTGTALNTWYLATGDDGVLYWKSVKTVTESGGVADTISASQATASRGAAIILIRKNPTTGVFYLRGQVPATAAVSTTVTAGSEKQPAYSLLASPSTTAKCLNDATWSGTIDAKDEIVYTQASGVQVRLRYVNSKWGFYWKGTFTELTATMPLGTGFWYVSRGGSPTIEW